MEEKQRSLQRVDVVKVEDKLPLPTLAGSVAAFRGNVGLSLKQFELILSLMVLTRETALQRASAIVQGSITYNLHLCLEATVQYSAYTEILFRLKEVSGPLPLDFRGSQITRLFLNGEVAGPTVTEGFIILPKEMLVEGQNMVGVHYTNKYDEKQKGCVMVSYPGEGGYVYTNLNPYESNRVYPCFDQPDLKAKYNLSVIYPRQWSRAISNEPELLQNEFSKEGYRQYSKHHSEAQIQIYLSGKQGKLSIFGQTRLMSTYLLCFAAGNFREISLQQSRQYKKLPMSLYCTEPNYYMMNKEAEFIFQVTIESMKFYQQFFSYDYPFSKYDHLFIDFGLNSAMENSGLVVVNQFHIQKSAQKVQYREQFASSISHELSHHWVGNLVTMKWWDDVWLHQGFATFFSFLFLDKCNQLLKTVCCQCPMAGLFDKKKSAMPKDSKNSHPLVTSVPGTDECYDVFDSITYRKGAGAVKQLMFLMGESSFQEGISEYLHRYEWSAADTSDFFAIMQKYYSSPALSLNQWKDNWIYTVGFDQVETQWKAEQGQVELTITRSNSQKMTEMIRVHKVRVALFFEADEVETFDVMLVGHPSTVVSYPTVKKCKAVLVNYEDHCYMNPLLDEVSSKFFVFNAITSNFIRDLLAVKIIESCLTSEKEVKSALRVELGWGIIYDGEWKGDLRHGRGTQTWPDGCRYDGEWEEGKCEGSGTMHYPEGDIYSGQWKDGRLVSSGENEVLQLEDPILGSDCYEGDLIKSEFHGKGSYDWKASKFQGEWPHNQIVRGTMKYRDGNFYEGEFSDGKRHGMGTFIYTQRAKYEGSWWKGRKHGFGSFTDDTGSLRKGEWARGQFIRWVPMAEQKQVISFGQY